MHSTKSDRLCRLWTPGDDGISVGSSVVTAVPSGGDVDPGGGCVCVMVGGMSEISVPSVQFCCECKTAPKKVFLKNGILTTAEVGKYPHFVLFQEPL